MKFFASVLLLALLASTSAQKLNFSFYITSSCGDTVNFVRNQLGSVYNDFKEYLNVEYIPWGKSVRNSDGSVTCQFGANDCAANNMQRCALYYLRNDQQAQTDYIVCEMVNLSSISQSYQCVVSAGLNATVVSNCVNSGLGDALETLSEEMTKEIVMVFVPTIVLNNQYSAADQNAAFSNFRSFVCANLPENVAACSA